MTGRRPYAGRSGRSSNGSGLLVPAVRPANIAPMRTLSSSTSSGIDPRDMRWSSRTNAGAAALHQWATLLSQEIAEMTVTTDAAPGFAARWARYGLGPIDLNLLASTRQAVAHQAGAASRAGPASFELLFARSGAINVEHCGRRSVVAPGCFILLDNDNSWDLAFPQGGDCPTVHMPKDWLLAFAPAAHDFCGTPLGMTSRWARPLASYIAAIADEGPASAGLQRDGLAAPLGAMASILLCNAAARPCPQSRDLRQRIVDCIADAYSDPELDPAAIACQLSISTRHLHRVLARSGLSFSAILRDTRIAAASSLLMSEKARDLPIGEIAWRAGYADQSHFARVFRTERGCSPARFREAARHRAN